MRTMRRAVYTANTMPLRLPTDSAILDANSTATIEVQGVSMILNIPDWTIKRMDDLVTANTCFGISVEPDPVPREVLETSTVSRDVLLEETTDMIPSDVPGIFIAARPVRRKLFEVHFSFPKGGLAKRKPFVWIPENPREE